MFRCNISAFKFYNGRPNFQRKRKKDMYLAMVKTFCDVFNKKTQSQSSCRRASGNMTDSVSLIPSRGKTINKCIV